MNDYDEEFLKRKERRRVKYDHSSKNLTEDDYYESHKKGWKIKIKPDIDDELEDIPFPIRHK